MFTNDDGPKGVQAMADILAANPEARCVRDRRRLAAVRRAAALSSTDHQYKAQIDSKQLVIVAADTIGEEVAIAKEGRVEALVGQRPFEMGYKAPSVMIDLIQGKKVDDPVFTGLDECTRATADTCIQK